MFIVEYSHLGIRDGQIILASVVSGTYLVYIQCLNIVMYFQTNIHCLTVQLLTRN